MDKSILNCNLQRIRICKDLSFDTRIHKVLSDNGINTVGDLVKKGESDLLKLPKLGRSAVTDIWNFLKENGLELDTDGSLSDEPVNDGIDWEQRRYEIARDVLASYTTRYNRDLVEWNPQERAKAALEQADALIELLKTKKGEG